MIRVFYTLILFLFPNIFPYNKKKLTKIWKSVELLVKLVKQIYKF
jgi:hypothetical protein